MRPFDPDVFINNLRHRQQAIDMREITGLHDAMCFLLQAVRLAAITATLVDEPLDEPPEPGNDPPA